ncbi:nucleoporin complex subunit 54-domain-containing protein [Absidia repens]|uniref:Nucleoporin complex subunit 54-domain-containing protein n=1 Tax=Absidia repens TaxID=90262 RepID=A0A1X2I6X7_9FUNG|nr:nucleoporin complex subunit 54-domain-containing protein [Absidia repens]
MSGFTFGNTTSQPSTGFGAPAAGHSAAGTLFGGTTNTGFGAATNNSTAPSAAGSLFGKPATSTPSAAGTLFGSTATSAPSSGGFGFNTNANATPASAAPATGFGGFGNPQQPASSAPGFSGFGTSLATATSTTPAPTSFGSFANNTQQPQAASTGGLSGFSTGFGANQQQQQQSAAGFGSTTGGGLFGQQKTIGGFGGFGQPASTGFGQPTSTGFGQPAPTGFGQTTSTGFGQPASTGLGQVQPQSSQPQQPQYNVWQQLALIKANWDPSSPLCQFRHYFYNMVPPNEVQLYIRPPNQDEQLWNEAQQKNPDPSCMVPVLAVGFEDVLKRMDIQDRQSELHKEKLEEISQRLETVRRKYELGSRARLEEHKRRHADLTQRIIRLLRVVQVIRYKGFPLSQQEELCQKQFEELSTQASNPEQLYTKMLELWSQLQAIKKTRPSSDNGHWEALNQNDTNRIAKVLGDEQQGLSHVIDILKKDLEDVKALEANLKLEAKNKENKRPLSI